MFFNTKRAFAIVAKDLFLFQKGLLCFWFLLLMEQEIFNQNFTTTHDIDTLLSLAQALTSKVIDAVIPFRRGFRRGDSCYQLVH